MIWRKEWIEWQNGCFWKIVGQPVHTTPNHHAPKVVVLPKTFLQIILDAKMVSAAFKYFTPTTSDNLDLPFFIYLLLRGSATSAMLLFRWLRSWTRVLWCWCWAPPSWWGPPHWPSTPPTSISRNNLQDVNFSYRQWWTWFCPGSWSCLLLKRLFKRDKINFLWKSTSFSKNTNLRKT